MKQTSLRHQRYRTARAQLHLAISEIKFWWNFYKIVILLDSGTTHNGISNPNLGYDIQKAKQPVRQETNSGSTVIDLDCKFPGVKGRVLMNPSGMANCFSLALLSDECRITMDTAKEIMRTVLLSSNATI